MTFHRCSKEMHVFVCLHRSSAHGISFDIPFGRDDMAPMAVGRGMSRSASTDGLGHRFTHAPRNMRRNLSFQPVNGQSRRGIEEEEGRQPGFSNGLAPDEHGPPGATPSIEEALQIIHSPEQPGGSLPADRADNGFFLHGQDSEDPVGAKGQAVDDQDSASTEMDTGIHVRTEDIQDEDSSLRDYTASMDSDADHEYDPGPGHPLRDGPSPAPSSLSGPSRAGSSASSGSGGVRMTSFAEQKFRKLNHHHPHGEGRGSGHSSVKTTPESSDLSIPHSVAWAPMPGERSPVRATSLPPSPRDPTHLLASEMLQLKMKLEEKRRAIEAQKKKVEAAFTRHRQRMGRTAFLNVVRKKGGGVSPLREEAAGSETNGPPLSPNSDARPRRVAEEEGEEVEENARLGQDKQEMPDGAEQGHRGWTRSPGEESATGEADLAEYTRSIERLNTSLSFLQTEMQRLAQQQEVIMQMREQQSWAASPVGPTPSPQRQVRELRGSITRSAGSLSPVLSSSGSPRPSHRSPTAIKRKSASFHSRTPRTPRPSDLKIAPFSRMLNTPQSVDSLPRLRRFSPSQTQLSSFAYFGHDEPTASPSPAPTHSPPPDPAPEPQQQDGRKLKPDQPKTQTLVELPHSAARGTQGPNEPKVPAVSQVLTQPVTEAVRVTPVKHEHTLNTSCKNLIEVPLSVLKTPEAQAMGNNGDSSGEGEPTAEPLGRDQKICCGFFFKVRTGAVPVFDHGF